MEFLARLAALGWKLVLPERAIPIPSEISSRYGGLPSDLQEFITSFEECVAPSDQGWFLSARTPDSYTFRRDDFEQVGLDAAGDDAEWAASIRQFWDNHFPFYQSVTGSSHRRSPSF